MDPALNYKKNKFVSSADYSEGKILKVINIKS
jgi:hypothetical protein